MAARIRPCSGFWPNRKRSSSAPRGPRRRKPAIRAGSYGSSGSANRSESRAGPYACRTHAEQLWCSRFVSESLPSGASQDPTMLTRKQHELLRFIHERVRESGVPPSFDEMKDALDLKSKSGIHRLITALEERGFIRRLPNRARALEVIRLPEAVAANGQRKLDRKSVV